jgi:hypothetical protein
MFGHEGPGPDSIILDPGTYCKEKKFIYIKMRNNCVSLSRLHVVNKEIRIVNIYLQMFL